MFYIKAIALLGVGCVMWSESSDCFCTIYVIQNKEHFLEKQQLLNMKNCWENHWEAAVVLLALECLIHHFIVGHVDQRGVNVMWCTHKLRYVLLFYYYSFLLLPFFFFFFKWLRTLVMKCKCILSYAFIFTTVGIQDICHCLKRISKKKKLKIKSY